MSAVDGSAFEVYQGASRRRVPASAGWWPAVAYQQTAIAWQASMNGIVRRTARAIVPSTAGRGAVAGLPTAEQLLRVLDRDLDGLITNGKFCCVRRVQLSLTWWRRPLDLRRSALHTDVALVGEPDDPDLDRVPPVQPAPRRRAPVGSGLPAAGASGRAGRAARPDADN